MSVTIHEFKRLRLKGAVLVDGIPTVTMTNAIAVNYLVPFLNLDHMAALDSELFLPVSMVYGGKPKSPARIYASEEKKVVAVLSEFVVPLELSRALAKALIDWSKAHGIDFIVSPLGLPLEGERERSLPEEVFAIGSTDVMREKIAKVGLRRLEHGVITGLSATLLNRGKLENFDVTVLVTPVYNIAMQYEAAARLLEALGKLVPQLCIEVKPLLEESKKFELVIRKLREQSRSAQVRPAGPYA